MEQNMADPFIDSYFNHIHQLCVKLSCAPFAMKLKKSVINVLLMCECIIVLYYYFHNAETFVSQGKYS